MSALLEGGAMSVPPLFDEVERRLALSESVMVSGLPAGPATLDLWYPVPLDGTGQDVLDVAVASDAPFQAGHDPDHGNPMRHVRLHGRLPERVTFRVDYVVSRTNAERQASDDQDCLRRVTTIIERARRQPGSSLQRARFLLDLLRSSGFRARLVAGHVPGRGRMGGDVELVAHHWAEVFVSELGWLPADPSCHPSADHPFCLGLDHVVRSHGEDLLLLPYQRGPRLPAFCETYAELNGRPHPVETRVVLRQPPPVQMARIEPAHGHLADMLDVLHHELARLTPAPPTLRLARGAMLTLASCDGQWLFLLVEGQVRLSRLSPAGRKLELGLHEAPELFLGGRLLRGVGEAVTDSVLVALSREQVLQVNGQRPEFGSLLLETLNDRMIESDERLEYLAYHSLASRLAMALLRLCDDRGVVDGLTHQQIGDIVGAYRETVTKVLHEFKRRGLVRLAHRHIELLDPLTLTRLQDD